MPPILTPHPFQLPVRLRVVPPGRDVLDTPGMKIGLELMPRTAMFVPGIGIELGASISVQLADVVIVLSSLTFSSLQRIYGISGGGRLILS